MGYDLYISRSTPIDLDEWKDAVHRAQKVRLKADDSHEITTPGGDVISFGSRPGDAEVLLPSPIEGEESEWVPVLFWFDGKVRFRSEFALHDSNDAFRRIASDLAQDLEARIVGEEDEEYSW